MILWSYEAGAVVYSVLCSYIYHYSNCCYVAAAAQAFHYIWGCIEKTVDKPGNFVLLLNCGAVANINTVGTSNFSSQPPHVGDRMYLEDVDFSELVGKTVTRIVQGSYRERLEFICADGSHYVMYHSQDCCESCEIEDICGNLDDLIGTPILKAELTTSHKNPKDDQGSFTWSFYHIATVKGAVTIRWYGTSNGYYSETVTFSKKVERT